MSQKQVEIELDIEELNSFIHQAKRQRTKDVLGIEVRRLQTELAKLIETNKNSENTAAAKNIHSSSSEAKCYDIKLKNYCWSQSDKYMTLYVILNNVHTLSSDAITCDFTERSMHLRVAGLENKNYQLPISNLCEDIDPAKSYTKVKTDKIVIYLAKKSPKSWSHVTGIEKRITESKTTKTEDFDSTDPEAGLMNLMKKMYEEGDDNMKRTIAKAWTEGKKGQSS